MCEKIHSKTGVEKKQSGTSFLCFLGSNPSEREQQQVGRKRSWLIPEPLKTQSSKVHPDSAVKVQPSGQQLQTSPHLQPQQQIQPDLCSLL